MKTKRAYRFYPIFFLLFTLPGVHASAQVQQGRVVINEYLPWTGNSCNVTSEFVELMNFGPGPMNIGCYILTDGDFAITIPPNTILQPGQFYVISGQDVIPAPCANIDSTIHASLNWNTCNCTSGPIPTTGDGLFTDGGSSNEQVVLLDPNLNVVDAVVRDLPAEPSSTITTAAVNGGCTSKTFNLDSMKIRYETLGMSTGRGNSFARKLDGDCGWLKDTQQSGNASNNTSGTTSDASYSLTIIKSMDCDTSHGSIDVYVSVVDYTNVFPMNYTIAYDVNNDGAFDFSDRYSYGVDSTPPSISILGLPLGRYKITVASVNGCYLKTFDVSILKCTGVLPTEQIAYFKLAEKDRHHRTFEWQLNEMDRIQSVELQKSMDGHSFIKATRLDLLNMKGVKIFEQTVPADQEFSFYRLLVTDKQGKESFSNVLTLSETPISSYRIWPNPARDRIYVELNATGAERTQYQLFNINGSLIKQGNISLQPGINQFTIPAGNLPSGIYQLMFMNTAGQQPFSVQFVKH